MRDFSRTEINSVSIIEGPVENFVKKNDLVLSTAIGFRDDADLFMKFLADIKNSQAAAILLSFKDNSYKISKNVIDYSNKIELPIFIIPWEVRFAEITNLTLKKINDKNIEAYRNVQDKLFNAYFTSDSFDVAAEIISSFLKTPVVITNKKYNLRGQYGKINESDKYHEIEIRLNKFLWGYIQIFDPENPDDIILKKQLIEKYVGLPLSLWFNKENVEDLMVMKLKNDFIWSLANNNYESFSEMVQQGFKLGFNLNKTYTCAAIKIVPNNASNVENAFSQESAMKTSEIESVINDEAKNCKVNIMFADRGLLFILYIENPEHSTKKIIDTFFSSLEKRLFNTFSSFKIYYGISEISTEKTNFNNLYKNASLALHYCLNSKGKSYCFTYRDTKVFHVMSTLQDNSEIKSNALETMNKLVAAGKPDAMNLVETLIEFIKCNHNISLTARNLNLHRQSLLYRLERIESLTEMSLNNRKDLFLLEIYTRIFSDY